MKSATDPIVGQVFLVGAGPGDPGLITLKGVDCLKMADVVIYDHLASAALLRYASPEAELVYAGKIGGRHNKEQGEINRLLVEKALAGKTVVRLKGGDPFVFGRGGEECEALAEAGIPFFVVPGVTAAIGASATAGIPLTHRDYTTSVSFVTGHEGDGKESSAIDWPRLSAGNGTIVFYMGMRHLRRNMEMLVAHGRPPSTPVALVRWGTTARQSVLVGILSDIADRAEAERFLPPALAIVGEVVTLRQRLAWFDNRPLFGRRVMVTRSAEQSGELSEMLEKLGVEVVEAPVISLIPPESWGEIDAAIAALDSFEWVVLTSANAVRFFFGRIRELGMDSRVLGRCRICVVGPKTAEMVRRQGLVPDLVPREFTGEGVVNAFTGKITNGTRVLFPRADGAREVIAAGLEEMGAMVSSPVLYRNAMPETLPVEALAALKEAKLDAVLFSASSTVRNLASLVGGGERLQRLLEGVTVASIGPVTTTTCNQFGLKVSVEPESSTLDALVSSLERYYNEKALPV